jgi:hypothetical protein
VPADQVLTHGGKVLEDARTLADYSITEGATLSATGRLRGGGKNDKRKWEASGDNIHGGTSTTRLHLHFPAKGTPFEDISPNNTQFIAQMAQHVGDAVVSKATGDSCVYLKAEIHVNKTGGLSGFNMNFMLRGNLREAMRMLICAADKALPEVKHEGYVDGAGRHGVRPIGCDTGPARPAETGSVKLMHIVQAIKAKHPGMKMLLVSADPDMNKQQAAFYRLFNAAKTSTTFVLINTGGLPKLFRGDGRPSPAEWLGIPSIDIVLYIKEDGRVKLTGTGVTEFNALMGSAADPLPPPPAPPAAPAPPPPAAEPVESLEEPAKPVESLDVDDFEVLSSRLFFLCVVAYAVVLTRSPWSLSPSLWSRWI